MCSKAHSTSQYVCCIAHNMNMIHCDLNTKLRKAAAKGTRLHLDAAHVQILMSARIYPALAILEAEELNALCHQDNQPLGQQRRRAKTAMSSAPSGCGIERVETTGPSAGTKTGLTEMDVGLAASRLASVAALMVSRHKRPSTL
jgi:hypothetical protein